MSVMEDPRLNGHQGEEDPSRTRGLIAPRVAPGGAGSSQRGTEQVAGEPPSGGGSSSGGGQICCLVENGHRCARPASNASYSKRIQGTVAQRKLKLQLDTKAQHIYICEFHKSVIQTVRTKRKRKDTEDSLEGGESVAGLGSTAPVEQGGGPGSDLVDLYQLQMNTLRRYKKHFQVTSRPGLNKAQLADSLTRHFKTIPVAEKETLTYFIYMIKTNRSKLDRDQGKPGTVQ